MGRYSGSALQTLHKVSCKAREQNYFQGGLTHDWVSYYEQRIESDRSCLNEWHAMDSLESRRPPSPDSLRTKPREREETECVIRSTLKEIMMSVDLDEVTSKYIRSRLEEDLDMDLGEYKSFIDQEMLTILGQMDAATEVFDHVYLGSEWNASNLEELQKNGVRHILNVTREIDNFFPGMFNYQNIRVYDDEKTDLLKHWDNTFKYITNAKKEGSKVLVHCKMGVSRSASVVIAYAMKAYNWDYKRAFDYVKQKRTCIKPNTSFVSQLETYQGILDAMKNREKLQRSKSETNLKSPGLSAKSEQTGSSRSVGETGTTSDQSCESRTETDGGSLLAEPSWNLRVSGAELGKQGNRPKSWSPDNNSANTLLSRNTAPGPASVSLEQLPVDVSSIVKKPTSVTAENLDVQAAGTISIVSVSPAIANQPHQPSHPAGKTSSESEARNYRMPCKNGQAYSVSQNKVVHLPASPGAVVPSVKHIVNELELQSGQLSSAMGKKTVVDRKGMVLNLTTQFESNGSKPNSPTELEEDTNECMHNPSGKDNEEEPVMSQTKLAPQMLTAVLVKKEIWDPGEKESPTTCAVEQVRPLMSVSSFVPSTENLVWTSSTELVEKRVPELSEVKYDTPVYISEVKLLNSEVNDERELSQSVQIRRIESNEKGGTRKEGDPFSAQVDRVFDREERKQQRASIAAVPVTTTVLPLAPAYLTEVPSDIAARECPSRQSSWSSYDSAVVLGYQGEPRNAPSRQSSWGSGDTKWTYGGTLPSRNSSWGSYDMRPPTMQFVTEQGEKEQVMEDLFGSSSSGMFALDRQDSPWYQGTVKRTKQKLEEGNNSTVKRVCSDSQPHSNSASPPSSGPSVTQSPSRSMDVATSGMNMKIHAPRPYQNPSSDRLLSSAGFPFPSVNHDLCIVDKTPVALVLPLDGQNSALIHYASSPTLCSHSEALNTSPDKMTTSQPNITILDSSKPCGQEITQPSAICRNPDYSANELPCPMNLSSSSLVESVCPLSSSAPTTSSSNLINSVVPMSSSLNSVPSVSSVCESPLCVLSFSVDPVSSTTSPSTVHKVKQHKRVLENLTNISNKNVSNDDTSVNIAKDSVLPSRLAEKDTQKSVSGLVQNLKKEFEAKSVTKTEKSLVSGDNCVNEIESNVETKSKRSDNMKVRSLPSSPVSVHPECKSPDSLSPASTTEDLSVRKLVEKYQEAKNKAPSPTSGNRMRFISENENIPRKLENSVNQPCVPPRKSSLDIGTIHNQNNTHFSKSPVYIHNIKNGTNGSCERKESGDDFHRPSAPVSVPSTTPSAVVASVMAMAASKKQQHGSTHPLSRLSINKPRHNNPVYNTM